MSDDDWAKPQVAVASSWNEVTPCNMPLDRLAKRAKEGVRAAGGFPIEFTTIAVSDGISMGHEGMRASLVSPRGHRRLGRDRDARRALRRPRHLRRLRQEPARHAHGRRPPQPARRCSSTAASILPGHHNGRALDIVSVFEAVGAYAAGTMTEAELDADRAQRLPHRGRLRRHVHRQHHGVGRRGHRHVAARLGVAAGRRPPPRRRSPTRSGEAVVRLLEAGIRPRQIMTKEAFENAIAVVMALGGSTNAVLHLLAIANEARVELDARRLQPRGGPRAPHRRHEAGRASTT